MEILKKNANNRGQLNQVGLELIGENLRSKSGRNGNYRGE